MQERWRQKWTDFGYKVKEELSQLAMNSLGMEEREIKVRVVVLIRATG